MRYQIRDTGNMIDFLLFDLREGKPVKVGNWEEIVLASQEMNLEDMADEARSRIPEIRRRT
jgi:hypothetical protein